MCEYERLRKVGFKAVLCRTRKFVWWFWPSAKEAEHAVSERFDLPNGVSDVSKEPKVVFVVRCQKRRSFCTLEDDGALNKVRR